VADLDGTAGNLKAVSSKINNDERPEQPDSSVGALPISSGPAPGKPVCGSVKKRNLRLREF
jgi:hypothetical protein